MTFIQHYFPTLSKHQYQQFEKLEVLYREWNAQINVISRKDIDALYQKHVLHSLGIANVQHFKSGTRVLDVGTGGGFPWIPLAILFPKVDFYLIDSIGKKIKVVQAVAEALHLKNVEARHQRAQEFKQGVQLIFGVPGLKVHTKICVIERLEGKKFKRYGFISTGNFNESTARIYTDYTLFTSHQKILKDVSKVFNFLSVNYKIKKYKHLIVSPHYTFSALIRLINQEIANKAQGKNARIRLKLNNITNYKIISKLYEASRAGVQIDMIVRGVCCLIPGVKGMSENIRVISVVDKFLEHPRVYIFENDGDPQMYISSADWMTRNIDNRVEVACPILDKDLQQELQDTFMISWNDNVKARLVNTKNQNAFVSNQEKAIRSQWATYAYFKEKLSQ